MSEKIRPTRFAHLEGHTDICYSDDGRLLITGGLDGDIRLFKGIDDDDCISHTLADQVHCIGYRNGSIIAGTNLNIVQSYTMEEGSPNGVVTRCTAFPTHINISLDKKLIAVASSDMTVKVHDTEQFQDLMFSGHEAPVLSVALDPKRDFLATSSCDGTVRIWNFRTQTLVRSFALLPKSNDFSFSSTLCRLCWSIDGQYLFVPVNTGLQVYNRNTWKTDFTLTHSSITGVGSIAAVSPNESYVALGCRDGRIVVWDLKKQHCITSEQSPKGMAITGLVWHPRGKEELAFVNAGGELGVMEKVWQEATPAVEEKLPVPPSEEVSTEEVFPPFDVEEEDNEFSIAKIKSQLGFADDEEGTFLGQEKSQDEESRPSSRMETPLPVPTAPVPTLKLPEPQKPFQPGMSPEHHTDRYMVWNSTGLVLQYQSEEEQSIEVEFHDSSVHHALHLNNTWGCSMAALNHQALALAAESQDDVSSKLIVHHFSAWDGGKEWQTEMPEGEDVLALGIGNGWVAAATDLRLLRIFSIAGTQKEVISIPGPVVCLAGFEKNLLVIYHSGIGVGGEQSMSAMFINTCDRNGGSPSSPIPVALSPKSFLMWAGFTDEGTPMIMDSAGSVKLLAKTSPLKWIPMLYTKSLARGKSDNYFILGANEVEGIARCILCKGSRYPPVVPRPHVSLLSLKVPLCEPESEKTCLEETAIRMKLLSSTTDTLAREGFDVEIPQLEIKRSLKESMIKLFALACRADRESRGVEVCEWMPTPDMVEVAVKYAAKLSRMQLAERLNRVVQLKVEEEEGRKLEEEAAARELLAPPRDEFYTEMESNASDPPSSETINTKTTEPIKSNPLLAAASRQNSKDNSFDRFSFTPKERNPFKKSVGASSGNKGAVRALDDLKIARESEASPVLRPFVKKIKTKSSPNPGLSKDSPTPPLQLSGKENKSAEEDTSTNNSSPAPATKRPSALKFWFDDNREMVKEKFPSASDAELLVKSAMIFKDIDDSIKQRYKLMASGSLSEQTDADLEKKRKPDETNGQEPAEKKKKSFESKLASFAFGKSS